MSQDKTTPRLSIDTCEALFEKLKWDFMQMEKDWGNSYSAFNFVITAYHLYQDWIKNAGTTEQKHRRAALPKHGKLLFNIWRDITNASKHWELNDKSQRKQVVNTVSPPQIGDWYAFLISGPVPYIQVGEARPSLTQLAHATIYCFKWMIQGDEAFAYKDLVRQLELIFRPMDAPPAAS